jgi:hypothetical protein
LYCVRHHVADSAEENQTYNLCYDASGLKRKVLFNKFGSIAVGLIVVIHHRSQLSYYRYLTGYHTVTILKKCRIERAAFLMQLIAYHNITLHCITFD